MSSWRPLVAGTLGLFLVILAFLAGQLKSGGDPALGQTRSAAVQQTAPQATPAPEQGFGAGPPEGGSDPSSSNGSAPGGATPAGSPPATHQS